MYGNEDHEFDATQQGRCPCGRADCNHCEGCGQPGCGLSCPEGKRLRDEEGPDDEHICDPDQKYPVHDAQGIFCFYACGEQCEERKKQGYRPEIFAGYGQGDVDEPIEPDYGPGEERW